MTKIRMAIFASGGGSNARKIMEYFKHSTVAEVALVVSNKKDAGVLEIAREHGIPTMLIDRKSFYDATELLEELNRRHIQFLVLAGFLWLVPAYLVKAFPGKILNIHPALLPKYGGKGMYGHHVHEAVKAAGERESGPTIHFVNEHYDEGDIVFQARCEITPNDSAEDIARKVLALEHAHYPGIIERVILTTFGSATTS
ncbi:MAG: phosphoribosylglycinamide formyltransferase [Saprospiraceae bacterium]|nr:phosphoribosylglycinamide formyltransferase [Saprospiraceae bacterium]